MNKIKEWFKLRKEFKERELPKGMSKFSMWRTYKSYMRGYCKLIDHQSVVCLMINKLDAIHGCEYYEVCYNTGLKEGIFCVEFQCASCGKPISESDNYKCDDCKNDFCLTPKEVKIEIKKYPNDFKK